MAHTLTVLGGAHNAWDDLSQVPETDLMAVNDIGMFCNSKHWYTNHGPRFRVFREIRAFENRGYRPAERYHTTSHISLNRDLPDWVEKWDIPPQGGSGLVAAQVGLKLGYEKIVLCGVPCTYEGHFYGPRKFREGRKGGGLDGILEHLRDRVFQGQVRSVSGLSREILGSPFDPW